MQRAIVFISFGGIFLYSTSIYANPFLLTISNKQNRAGIFLEKKTYENTKKTNSGILFNLNKNISEIFDFGFYSTFSQYDRTVENYRLNGFQESIEKRSGFFFSPYFSISWLKFGGGIEKQEFTKNIYFAEINIFDTRKLFFGHSKIQNIEKCFFFGVRGGDSVIFGLQAERRIFSDKSSEYSISLSLNFQIGKIETGVIQNFTEKNEGYESIIVASYNFTDTKQNSVFGKEKNPIFEEEIKFKKKLIPKKIKNEKIVYPLTLNELLKEKIPLAIALKIQSASKSRSEYEKAIKTLPPAIVKKLNYLQFKKKSENLK